MWFTLVTDKHDHHLLKFLFDWGHPTSFCRMSITKKAKGKAHEIPHAQNRIMFGGCPELATREPKHVVSTWNKVTMSEERNQFWCNLRTIVTFKTSWIIICSKSLRPSLSALHSTSHNQDFYKSEVGSSCSWSMDRPLWPRETLNCFVFFSLFFSQALGHMYK